MLNKSQYILLASVTRTEVRLSADGSVAGVGAVIRFERVLYYEAGSENRQKTAI